MVKFYVGNEFFSAISENDVDTVSEGVKEVEDKLSHAWKGTTGEEFAELLALCVQRFKRARRDLMGWQTSTMYQIGLLDGIVSTYDRLYQGEKERVAIDQHVKQILPNSGPVARKVFTKLFQLSTKDEWISHGDLAKAIGTSPSSLSNIMKRLVLSRAVESEKDGKYTNYRLTSAGSRYYEEKFSRQRPEDMFETVLAALTGLGQKIDTLGQRIDENSTLNHDLGDINILIQMLALKTSWSADNIETTQRPNMGRASFETKSALHNNNDFGDIDDQFPIPYNQPEYSLFTSLFASVR